MQFTNTLIPATIKSNINNLIIDVELADGSVHPVFCPDPNRLDKLYTPGNQVFISPLHNPQGKLHYELTLINSENSLIMSNPRYINELLIEAFSEGKLTDFKNYTTVEFPTKEGLKRLNLIFNNNNDQKAYIYATYIYNKIEEDIYFPSFLDLKEISVNSDFRELRKKGFETYVVLLVPTTNFKNVKFSWTIDPIAAAQTYEEAKNGIKFVCYGCNLDLNGVEISHKLDIKY